VAAMGRAPLAATLRAASATACMAPSFALSWHQRPLPSVARAKAFLMPFFSDSLIRTTPASLAPGPARVLVRTEGAYWSGIQRFEAMAGEASSFLKFSVRFLPSGANSNQSFSLSNRGDGGASGRL